MQATHAAVLNTLTRVQRFLDANAAMLGTINTSSFRAVLDDVVNSLAEHAVSQTTSKRVATAERAKQRVLRSALKLNHMRPIATVAAAQLKQVPEFAALKMPPANSTSRTLIACAGAMAAAASDYARTFTDAGLSVDFLAQMHSAAAALDTSLADGGATRSSLSGATAGLTSEATRGRQAVKVLDALVEPQLAGNIALLSQWKTAKRFGGRTLSVSSTSVDAAAKGVSSDPASASAVAATSAS